MIAPLSPEQLAVWKHQRYEHRRVEPNVPVTMRLFGLVDNDALAAAVRDVTGRHEILDVAAAPELSIRKIDTWNMAQVFKEASDREFDLVRETPVRAHLFSAGRGEHTLLFVFPRVAFDSRSVSPLVRDLFECYSARLEKREPNLPPLAMQYADYACLRTWSVKNAPVQENTVLPTDSAAAGTESRGVVPIRINPGLHGMMLDFAKEVGVSVESVLYAGFAVLCVRLGLGGRVIVDAMDSVRDKLPDTIPMIGCFETILTLEIDTQGNPVFREVVKHVARAYSAASEQEKPGIHPIGEADSKDSAIRFRTLFRVKPVGMETLELPMLKVFVSPVPVTETGFGLIFDLSERLSPDGKPQGMEGSVTFDRNLLAPRHMPTHLDRMMTLLKHGVRNPDARIDELELEEKPTAWAKTALARECQATEPEHVPMARVATVHDNGRSERIPLTEPVASSAITAATGWQQSHVAFQDALQCRLSEIWEETLGVSRVGVRDRFADLGGDAGKARRVVRAIGKVFRRNLPASLMCGGATVESLASAIFRELPFEPVSTIQPEEPGMKPPLFFAHGDVFGGGLYTVELARHLGADRPFFSLNPHGMDGRCIPESIEEMAEDYLKVLRRMRPEGPFWLGGFCSGALVAYEMARMLEREGRSLQTPVLLVETPPGDIAETPVVKQASRSAREPAAPPGSQMRKVWVLNELFQLSGRYKPGRYTGPVIAVHPEKSLSDETLVRSVWEKAADDIRFINTPGDHITCIGRHAPELADILRGVMDADVLL